MKTEEIKKNNTQEDPIINEPEKIKKEKKPIIIKPVFIIIGLILIILATCSIIFAVINKNTGKIVKGIYINNIEIGGKTKEQAIEKIKNEINTQLDNNSIKLSLENNEYLISARDIEFNYNIEEAINKAYEIGREKNIFKANLSVIKSYFSKQNIEANYVYNEDLLQYNLDSINKNLQNPIIQVSYHIEDDELIIIKGKPGNTIDYEKAKEQIINGLKNNDKTIILLEQKEEKPEEINIEKIYNEIYTEPKNAYYTENPFKVFAHVDGIDFDIEEAKKILEEEKDEYKIKLKITKPDVLTSDIGTEAFPNLLSSFSTKFDAYNTPRVTNLRLASKSLNEVVIMQGETFSYNKTLGKRTSEAGYRNAGGFAGGRVVDMLGGGICQISSTLYNAAILADLEITERYAHMFQALYVDPGRDATVAWGSLDFKFKNTRSYPIMLKAWIEGNRAYVEIYGTKEEVEYEIEIESVRLSYSGYGVIYEDDPALAPGQEKVAQNGIPGCSSIAYKIKKLNGEQISKEVLSQDYYKVCNKIIKRGIETESTITEPEEPQVPIEPELPVLPVEPTVPETPVEPDTPAEPSVPETPVEPVVPVEPTVPETPTKPEEPQPEVPEEPDEPTQPEDPGEQETPAA